MNDKILGLDLGTNSIGILLRNLANGADVLNQIDYFTSVVFKSGIGREKSGEFSYAAKTEKQTILTQIVPISEISNLGHIRIADREWFMPSINRRFG